MEIALFGSNAPQKLKFIQVERVGNGPRVWLDIKSC